MAALKTQFTDANVNDFIAAVENPGRREDARILAALFSEMTGEPAGMFGPSIIAFGRHHYRYDSGHEGDMPLISFSPRKANTVLYISRWFDGADALVARLGKVKQGKACLYVNRLADIDLAVLRDLGERSLGWLREHRPG